jgi:diguanylate cyclase (GGDEF)-like protein
LRHQILPWLIFAISLLVTYLLWQNERHHTTQDLQTSFDFTLRESTARIEQRMTTYEQMLRGVQGLFSASDSIGRESFKAYVESLEPGAGFSGGQGLGLVQIVMHAQKNWHTAALRQQGFPKYTITPEGQREIYTPIVQIEPLSGLGLQMIGYDPYSEPALRGAMEQARDLGSVAISGKIATVADAGLGGQSGFLMYFPLYKKGMPRDTVASRRASIVGWAFAPIGMNDLMASLYGERTVTTALKIYDGVEMSNQTLMYESASDFAEANESSLSALEYIEISGHTWTLAMRSLAGFEGRFGRDKSMRIASAGIVLGLLLAMLTWQLTTTRERAVAIAKGMTHELRELATTDFLTDLSNRRHFMAQIEQELARVQRLDTQQATVVVLDLDHFKRINDTHGHAAGDAVLKHFAALLRGELRKIDTAGRMGGEEFAIILPGANATAAQAFGERLRKKVAQTTIMYGGQAIRVTVSIGIATMTPEDTSADAALVRADEALYRAKEGGRDRVEVAIESVVRA